jgi:ribosomal-protein-alanine acetyltransferase
MTWQLRRAVAEDVDAIMAIEERLFSTDAWSRESMAAELADRHGYYLVATPLDDPARIDGYAGLRAPHGADQADIQTLAVVESARRRGLGRVLLTTLLGEARQRGAHEVFLEVRADNPGAQALYTSAGFEAIAVRPRYYQPDDVDAVIMRCALPEPEVRPA